MSAASNHSADRSATPSPIRMLKVSVDQFDLLKLHQAHPERYPFLLESVAQSQNFEQTADLAQFDILFAFPQNEISLAEGQSPQAFVESFERDFKRLHLSQLPDEVAHLPFTGGWFAYFSYDYAKVVEPTLKLPSSELPLAKLVRVPCAFIYERHTHTLYLLAEIEYESCLTQMQADLDASSARSLALESNPIIEASEEPENKYLEGIHAIKEYILAGDIFQVNLSRQWRGKVVRDDAPSVYAALRKHNPAPFAALVDFGDWQVISSSPERLVRYRAPWVETRPIAGTRKRSEDLEADKALIAELRSHPKEIAEHIMLIDLERNDLGRICRPGSVEVNELMVVETYEHVHHIVSNVRGRLQDGLSPLDVIHATFPGGTITGCPKIRCMEIIAELEQMPREAYTGSLGYINRDGSLDLNILIRTMLKRGREVTFRAGAGIVADSIPERELMESRHKAKGLIQALEKGC
ncbi:MAG: aminodeoxychorismate synthase component I [Hydrogenovibrio sp.]|nr:aminodeoxychorismate synthase component I [Hydrogenovibrio sp.]